MAELEHEIERLAEAVDKIVNMHSTSTVDLARRTESFYYSKR